MNALGDKKMSSETKKRELLCNNRGTENQTLLRHIESKRSKWKQQITYLMNLYKWIAQWGLREIVKRQILLELQRIGSCGEL